MDDCKGNSQGMERGGARNILQFDNATNNLLINATAEGPNTPDVSTESRTRWQPDTSDAYFRRFESSTAGAADPGKADEAVKSERVKVSEQVASDISDFSCWNGKTVMPSRCRPSPRSWSTRSSTECVPAASRAGLLLSFRAE